MKSGVSGIRNVRNKFRLAKETLFGESNLAPRPDEKGVVTFAVGG